MFAEGSDNDLDPVAKKITLASLTIKDYSIKLEIIDILTSRFLLSTVCIKRY